MGGSRVLGTEPPPPLFPKKKKRKRKNKIKKEKKKKKRRTWRCALGIARGKGPGQPYLLVVK
jgi:hypothetical protein